MTEEKRKELIDALVKATGPVLIMMQGPFPPEMEMPNEYDAYRAFHHVFPPCYVVLHLIAFVPFSKDTSVRVSCSRF